MYLDVFRCIYMYLYVFICIYGEILAGYVWHGQVDGIYCRNTIDSKELFFGGISDQPFLWVFGRGEPPMAALVRYQQWTRPVGQVARETELYNS